MEFLVNGEKKNSANPITLAGVVESLGLVSARGIAVAINEQVVERGSWSERFIKERDSVLIITAAQGG